GGVETGLGSYIGEAGIKRQAGRFPAWLGFHGTAGNALRQRIGYRQSCQSS
ncbi:MAG: hypothetical protein JO182_05910, partial [Acidobacteriaceae bacterium]|nr:hypothetical protein [Acidobacteriaceae bacterium]